MKYYAYFAKWEEQRQHYAAWMYMWSYEQKVSSMTTLFLKALPMNTGINFRATVALRMAPYTNIVTRNYKLN